MAGTRISSRMGSKVIGKYGIYCYKNGGATWQLAIRNYSIY